MQYGIVVETLDAYTALLEWATQRAIHAEGLDYEKNQLYYIGGVADYLMDDRLFAQKDGDTWEPLLLDNTLREAVKLAVASDCVVEKIYQLIEQEVRAYLRTYQIEMEVI